jgi:sigma-B regulation protein RsbU (phosphoserine phosphatase)
MALGVQAEFSYATGKVRLGRGDTLFLSTDGITEAVNPQDELFSKSRLEAVLRDAVDRPITALVDGVAEAVKTFADAAPQSDDITAMALRLK